MILLVGFFNIKRTFFKFKYFINQNNKINGHLTTLSYFLKMLLNDDLKEIVLLMYEKIREFPEIWK